MNIDVADLMQFELDQQTGRAQELTVSILKIDVNAGKDTLIEQLSQLATMAREIGFDLQQLVSVAREAA